MKEIKSLLSVAAKMEHKQKACFSFVLAATESFISFQFVSVRQWGVSQSVA